MNGDCRQDFARGGPSPSTRPLIRFVNDHTLLAAYRATTWTIATARGEIRIHLADPVPLPTRSLGIITAYNPASLLRTDEENRAANPRLRAELKAAGGEIIPALASGTGPDAEQWTEPGFAVYGLSRAALIAFGRRFGQNAIVWIDARGRPALVVTRPGFGGSRAGDTV